MFKKQYIDIDDIIETDEIVEMIDIEVNTPDNTFLLGNGILTHNSNVGIVNQLTVDAFITSQRGLFVDKNYIEDDKSGILSVNSAMIPFVGSTDGCRVMFSASQGRQSIPIMGAEPPLVQTGYESMMTHLLSDSYVKKALEDGTIVKIDQDVIVIKLKNGRLQTISLDPKILRSGQGQNSVSHFKPTVNIGDKVKKNQIISEGSHIRDGVISIGSNLLCAVMTWEGYSYEDGYIISDTLANNKFKSESFHEIEVVITKDDNLSYVVEENFETKIGEPLLVRSSKSIESMIGSDLDEIEQGNIITKSPGGKVVAIEIYPNMSVNKFPLIKPQFDKFRQKYIKQHGDFPSKFQIKLKGKDKEYFSGILIKFKISKMENCVLGDKITNNFGGKGVLAQIEKEQNMPMTPFGERVEVILNPIAIINRMNPSTIKEMYMGLVAKFIAKHLVSFGEKKNKKAIDLLKKIYILIDGTKNKSYSKQLIKSLELLSERQYIMMIREIVAKNYFFPIIVPPFKEPSLSKIEETIKLVGAKTAYYLKLPKYGVKTANPIACGYIYYKKLEQQSGIKMSARSTGGLVSSKTGQPLAGKKVQGGQRIGEMDSWAIINHGAINTLKELYGPLSDDLITKNEIINEIVQTGSAGYREPKVSPTRDLLEIYFKGLMLDAPIKEK